MSGVIISYRLVSDMLPSQRQTRNKTLMKQWIDEAMHEATGKTNQTRKDTVWKNNKDVK